MVSLLLPRPIRWRPSTVLQTGLNPVSLLRGVFAQPDVRRLALAFFGFFMAFNGFTTILVLYLRNAFNWTEGMAGAPSPSWA